MGLNVTQKLIQEHLIDGEMQAGREIGLRMDQTLTQDATGTMVMLEFEAMNIGRARTELSAQYVDHNLLQTDYRNADDHLFLRSACRGQTATPRLPADWACWLWAPAVWKWLRSWPGSPYSSPCPR